jgi:hypothetical protein
MPLKGWKKDADGKWYAPSNDEEVITQKALEPDLPISEKLSDILARIKTITQEFRNDMEIKVIEQANQTTSIEVLIRFAVK